MIKTSKNFIFIFKKFYGGKTYLWGGKVFIPIKLQRKNCIKPSKIIFLFVFIVFNCKFDNPFITLWWALH